MKHIIEIEGASIVLHYRPPFEEDRLARDSFHAKNVHQTEEIKKNKEISEDQRDMLLKAANKELTDFMFNLTMDKLVYKIEGELPDTEWITVLIEEVKDKPETNPIKYVLFRAYYMDVLEIPMKYFAKKRIDPNDNREVMKLLMRDGNFMKQFLSGIIDSGQLERIAEKNL